MTRFFLSRVRNSDGRGIVDAQPAVEVGRGLEGPLDVQAGVGDGVERPAELGDQHELGFADREERQPQKQNGMRDDRGGRDNTSLAFR